MRSIWLYLPWGPDSLGRRATPSPSTRAEWQERFLEYSDQRRPRPRGSNILETPAWGLAIFTRNDKRVARSAVTETEN